MSQAGILSDSTGPGSDVETLTGNTGGAVGPDGAFNINIVGDDTTITVVGDPGTNTLTISAINGISGTTTTVGAVTGDAITIPLGATPATYHFDVRVAAFESTTPAGGGYQVVGAVRTDGATATLTGVPDVTVNEEAALVDSDCDLVVSGNNAIIRVLGVDMLTINWAAQGAYTSVS